MKETLKKIAIRLLLLTVVSVGVGLLYQSFWYEEDLDEFADTLLKLHDLRDSVEILYLGESSNFSRAARDQDRGEISTFIERHFPHKKWGVVNKGGIHAGIYLSLLNNISDSSPIETVIVTLNLRSFDAGWVFSKLETPLQKSQILMRNWPPIINRFALSFKDYQIKSAVEWKKEKLYMLNHDTLKFPYPFEHKTAMIWDKALSRKGIRNADGSLDRVTTNLSCHLVKNFAFQIDTLSHPRIQDLDGIAALAKKRNWNLVFNLLSENMDKAEELVGKDLVYLMDKNRDLLVERYTRKGVVVVDNLYTVPNEEFIDQKWPTEHYAEEGRKTVAYNVAMAMRKEIYPNEFIYWSSPVPSSGSVFFNNCEGKVNWTGIKSLSKEQAYSGEMSSKIGGGRKFSLTLEMDRAQIPDSLFNRIHFTCQLWQEDGKAEPKLGFEFYGEGMKVMKTRIPLEVRMKVLKRWQKTRCYWTLPEKFKKADRLKIYVYNNTPFKTYVDDIRIEFTK